jgi:hypothetical protein
VPSIAVTGGTFYAGDKFPGWRRSFFVGGLRQGESPRTGHMERIEFNDKWEEIRREPMLVELHQRIRDVRQGPDGLLYVATGESAGAILRIEPAPAPGRYIVTAGSASGGPSPAGRGFASTSSPENRSFADLLGIGEINPPSRMRGPEPALVVMHAELELELPSRRATSRCERRPTSSLLLTTASSNSGCRFERPASPAACREQLKTDAR